MRKRIPYAVVSAKLDGTVVKRDRRQSNNQRLNFLLGQLQMSSNDFKLRVLCRQHLSIS